MKTRQRTAPKMPDRLAFVVKYYGGGDTGGAALWLRDVYGCGFRAGSELVERYLKPATDLGHKADELLKALEGAGWIERVSYCPSHSSRAFLGLERKTNKAGVPPYTYPREHGYGPTAHPEALRFVRRVYRLERAADADSR